jgi:hypothetical protein
MLHGVVAEIVGEAGPDGGAVGHVDGVDESEMAARNTVAQVAAAHGKELEPAIAHERTIRQL